VPDDADPNCNLDVCVHSGEAPKRSQLSLSQKGSSSFGSETLACCAMNPSHPFWNWSAEMMAPARWCVSKGKLRRWIFQWRNKESVMAELDSDTQQLIWAASETLTSDAMNHPRGLWNWIREMMAPTRWCRSKGHQLRCLSSQRRNIKGS
jgi:hypothetical protein